MKKIKCHIATPKNNIYAIPEDVLRNLLYTMMCGDMSEVGYAINPRAINRMVDAMMEDYAKYKISQ